MEPFSNFIRHNNQRHLKESGPRFLKEPEEKIIIQRCQAGDREAFRSLAERYEAMLYGIAYLMVHEKEHAADMVQETLLKMWTHLPALRNTNKIKPWLIRILTNEINEKGRKRKLPSVDIENYSELPDESEGIEKSLERHETRKSVRDVLTNLPEAQRETVVLRYFGDMKISEIAFVMGCRKGTVKSRLNRALNTLEKSLRSKLEVADS